MIKDKDIQYQKYRTQNEWILKTKNNNIIKLN